MPAESPRYEIAVVGPGAIGCLFGGLLKEAGHRVIMLDHRPERAESINRKGIHIEGISGTRDIAMKATANPSDVAGCDFALIATKSYDTGVAVNTISGVLRPSTPVMTLQNGLGNVELISRAVGDERTIGGITSQGATLLGDGSVRHAGAGKTVIGTPSNRLTENLRRVKGMLDSSGFAPQISDDLESTIWSKLLINVGINALTAITRLNNGRLLEFGGTRSIMQDAVREAVAVADARGIALAHGDPLAQVEEVCRLTAANVSSMLQDVLARRRTEIDAINGAVARIGLELGIPTPVNSVLASLVHTIESSYHLQVSR
ncbi:MAG: 2-dehydropantoate 2-reductase [Candidatus Abyssobacteria bacterium SURF_17]|uniref:2-dehydropantoate 2-reductase n=1 Tax=Candidatus Abyssobacteria bacterium SURF_17 TaxID=2093361 RepID=A0A419F5Y9_9BACT|nr:MAG: 2-dehydropantoate 2-reductase [Candidatus Abyssubacteria bacterium SURF_17]